MEPAPLSAERGGVTKDRCVFSRTFTPAFADDPGCAAYQPAAFTATDTANRPLGTTLTCRHLVVGTAAGNSARFYPRCGLGDATARVAWVAAVTPARLEVVRSLEEELEAVIAETRLQLIGAKERMLAASDDPEPFEELEVMLSGLLDLVDGFIDQRAVRLEDAGLPPAQLRSLMHEWSLAWLRSRATPPLATLTVNLDPDSAAFLGAHAAPPAQPVPRPSPTGLAVETTTDPPSLRVTGTIDAATSAELDRALSAATRREADLVIDFTGVVFCDLSGLRALVRAAGAVGEGHRLVVHGMPGHLQRALRIAGWAELPSLTVVGRRDGP